MLVCLRQIYINMAAGNSCEHQVERTWASRRLINCPEQTSIYEALFLATATTLKFKMRWFLDEARY